MTDRDALLAAVRAAPDDDAPRLVYADWLEENGVPDCAAFIRAACAAARPEAAAGPRPPPPAADPAVAAWLAADGLPVGDRARVQAGTRPGEVCVRGRVDYLEDGRPGSAEAEYVLRRGFVAEATLPWPAFRAAAPALFRAHPVGWVALAGAGPVTRAGLSQADAPDDPGYDWWAWGVQWLTPSTVARPMGWMVPEEVWDRLAGGEVGGPMDGLRLYHTPLEAHAALSAAACLAVGRVLAGVDD